MTTTDSNSHLFILRGVEHADGLAWEEQEARLVAEMPTSLQIDFGYFNHPSFNAHVLENIRPMRLDIVGGYSDSFVALAQVWTQLRHLNLSDLKITCENMQSVISVLTSVTLLEHLDLSNNFIDTTTSLSEASKSFTLTETLQGTFAKAIQNLAHLKHFNLSRVDLPRSTTDLVLCFIGDLTNLEHLDLSHTDFEHSFSLLNQLMSLTRLQHLNLSHTCNTALPREFGSLLPFLSSLKYLNISNICRPIDDASLVRGLLSLVHLETLVINDSPFQGTGERCLPSNLFRLTKLRHLYLNNYRYDEAELGSSLLKLTQLESLSLGRQEVRNDLLPIAQLTQLRYLNLESSKITEMAFCEQLGKLTQLHFLSFRGAHLNDSEFDKLVPELAKLTCLTHLDLSQNGLQNPTALVDALKGMYALTYLNLGDNCFDHLALQTLSQVPLPSLRFFSLKSNPFGQKNVSSTEIALKRLGWEGDEALSIWLGSMPELTHLDLTDCSLTTCDLFALSHALSRLPRLQKLFVTSPSVEYLVDRCGVLEVVDSIRHLTQLVHLKLCLGLTDAEGCVLSQSLSQCIFLQHLLLKSNRLGPDTGSHFAQILKKLTRLRTLDLSSNGLGDEGVKATFPALLKLVSRLTLSLGGNDMSQKTYKVMNRLLPHLPMSIRLPNEDVYD